MIISPLRESDPSDIANGRAMPVTHPLAKACISGVAAACGISLAATGWLVLFSDRFERGATLSGLNPDGGGPGFLLILTSGIISALLRPKTRGGTAPPRWTARLIDASLVAVSTGVLSYVLMRITPALALIEREPIVSAIAVSAFVPRVIAATLEPVWAERACADEGATAPPKNTRSADAGAHRRDVGSRSTLARDRAGTVASSHAAVE